MSAPAIVDVDRCSRCAIDVQRAADRKLYVHEPTQKLYCGRCKWLFVDRRSRVEQTA